MLKTGSGTITVKNGKNLEVPVDDVIYYNNLIYDADKTTATLGAGFSGTLKTADYASRPQKSQ